ncbi:MAG: energy-coupling factor transporter transmembrane protein EcfT [Propionibacteriales bacterium]|nr:energy-coupling factor transporter transmembrane protein EcfT [Propionibacteriales bacterium]
MTAALPDWLATPATPATSSPRRPHRFLRRTINQLERLLATLSEPPTRFTEVDPRVKLVTALAVLVVLALMQDPLLLTVAGLLACTGTVAAGAGRALVGIAGPIVAMTAIVLLPATTSIVRPGTIVLPLGDWAGQPVGLTSVGITGAWLVLTRLIASLAVVVLLTRTTSWLRLTAALRAIGAPAAFVLIATMAHRYLWVLGRGVVDLLLARRARSIGGATGREDRAFVGGSVGALYVRSNELADQVHQAMVARGFTGRLADPTPRRIRWVDLAIGGAIIVAALGLLWGDIGVR